jgi:UDP-N-acetylglucosamine 2-epimerase (non-hydrolysing)
VGKIKQVDVIFGTRPEAIKMAVLARVLKTSQQFQVRVISTGQHREMLIPILEWFEIVPDADLELMEPGQTLSSLSSKCISRLQQFYDERGKPDLVLVQGDTTTAFIAALVAFYNKIRIGHVEAGLRTHNKFSPWPEEMNRVLLTRLADFHFAPTEENVRHLVAEGVQHETIHRTGNTVIDALLFSQQKITDRNIYPEALEYFFVGEGIGNRVVLVTGHRRENFGEGFKSICEAIKMLALQYPDVAFVYPVHLNPNVQKPVMELLQGVHNVHLIEPLGYPEFISLMNRSYLILTDSGGVQEEGPSLGKPVLVMRENTERPEALQYGTVILTGTSVEKIYNEVSLLLTDTARYKAMSRAVNPYGDGKSAQRIVQVIGEA